MMPWFFVGLVDQTEGLLLSENNVFQQHHLPRLSEAILLHFLHRHMPHSCPHISGSGSAVGSGQLYFITDMEIGVHGVVGYGYFPFHRGGLHLEQTALL